MILNVASLFGFPAKEVYEEGDTHHEQPIAFENNSVWRIQGLIMTYGILSISLWNIWISYLVIQQKRQGKTLEEVFTTQIESRSLITWFVLPFWFSCLWYLFDSFGPSAYWWWFDTTDHFEKSYAYPINMVSQVITYWVVWVSLSFSVISILYRVTRMQQLEWIGIVYTLMMFLPSVHFFIILRSNPNSSTWSIFHVLWISSMGVLNCVMFLLDPKMREIVKKLLYV